MRLTIELEQSNPNFYFNISPNSYFGVRSNDINDEGEVVLDDLEYLMSLLQSYNHYLQINNIGYDRLARTPYQIHTIDINTHSSIRKYPTINEYPYHRTEKRFSEETGIRVYHFTNIPCKPFHVNVKSLTEAKIISNLLTNYDAWLYNVNLRNDYACVTGLEYRTSDVFEEDVDKGYSWYEFNLDYAEELCDKLISFPEFIKYNGGSDYISTEFDILDLTLPILNFIDQYRKDSYFLYKPLLSLN